MKNTCQRKKKDNIFAKFRFVIWIQLVSLIPLVISLAIANSYIREVFQQHKTIFIILMIIIFFFYNLTFITSYNMGKTIIVHEAVFIFSLMIAMILLTQVQVDSSYSTDVIITIVGLVLTMVIALIGLVIAYINNNLLNSYIGYNETLVDLSLFGFAHNGKILDTFKVLRTKNEVKFEINGTWRKFQISQLKEPFFQGANIFGRIGHIKFTFQENEFELMYKKVKTDIVVYALYYNLIRKITN